MLRLIEKNKLKISISSSGIVLLLMILGLFARLYGLEEYDFIDDELWHLTVAGQKNIWEVIKYNFQEEVHPPLSYIIWHFALQFSHGHLFLRMPGIIAGILIIPSAYLFGKLYIGRYAGYSLAFIAAFSPILMAISISIRAYSLMILCLLWAAIFVYKYCNKPSDENRKKYLILYSICCFLAISLNHAACFAIFSLGLILIVQTIKEKSKKDFIIIAAIHAFLVLCILTYLYILTVYFGYEGIAGFFTQMKSVSGFIYLYTVNVFQLVSDMHGGVTDLLSIIVFIVTPILLIKDKKYLLLNIVYSPVLVVIICDYFDFYPFSPTARNNLFLILSLFVSYAYIVQVVGDFFREKFKDVCSEKIRTNVFGIFVILLMYSTVEYLIDNNFSRTKYESCKEFSVKKSDTDILHSQLNKHDKENNIFITIPRNMWYWKFNYNDAKYFTVLTENLAKFENEEITIYFSASSPLVKNEMDSMIDYQLFFKDLFKYLDERGELSTVKSFTFFDMGLKIDNLSRSFHPQFIPPKKSKKKYSEGSFASCKNDLEFGYRKEEYNISWVINTSNQVLDRFYHTDPAFSCGREIFVLSFTPKFVRDEILNINFLNLKNLEKAKCAK